MEDFDDAGVLPALSQHTAMTVAAKTCEYVVGTSVCGKPLSGTCRRGRDGVFKCSTCQQRVKKSKRALAYAAWKTSYDTELKAAEDKRENLQLDTVDDDIQREVERFNAQIEAAVAAYLPLKESHEQLLTEEAELTRMCVCLSLVVRACVKLTFVKQQSGDRVVEGGYARRQR